MNLRAKIMLTYSVLLLSLTLLLGIFYNNYKSHYELKEYDNLKIMTEKISQQFEETVKPMEFVSEYLLSDIEVLDALVTLTAENYEQEPKATYVKEAKEKIQLKLNSYYITKNFYRVLTYNSFDSVVASQNYREFKINEDTDLNDLSWLGSAKNKGGKPILTGVRQDEWGLENKEQVFSLVKEIQGMSMGYIEVQKKATTLNDIFSIEREDIDVIAIQSSGDLLYSSIELADKEKEHYTLIAKDKSNNIGEYSNPINDKKEIISSLYSDITQTSVLLIEDKESIQKSISSVMRIVIFIAISTFLFAFLYIVIASSLLTKPIRQLKYQIEKTGLGTLDDKIEYDKSNDEIAALSKVYQKMLKRLNEAIIEERKKTLLQLEAQYDALQAQVNPHFLYNVLNVISYRGIKNNDEVISDMCYNLASMLRYSTNNIERESYIEDEVEHLKSYFYLLKMRYEHKLEYEISVENVIKKQLIPKIILQQIVENSVNHGFDNIDQIMKIVVKGWEENNNWYINIRDNGQGLTDEMELKIKNKILETKELLKSGESNIELKIGGMGLINTYARLFLVYGEGLLFRISSNENGTNVTIGAPIVRGEV